MAREELTVHLKADDDLTPAVRKASAEVDKLDHKDVDVKVTADTADATSAFGKFKAGIADAEGGIGKLKAAGSGAFDMLKENAGSFALAGGTALVAFGAKAVGAMQEVALGAGELRDALGLTAEEASRWQEVAGDLGISNGTLESVIGRMNKTLGATPALFKTLGVEVAKTADGSTDVNQTFLNTIDTLNKIKDPAARAAAAAKLLGKGWQDAAELIGLGADQVKESLAGVEDQKIVTDDQIAQSRRFRDTLDNLHDAAEDVSLTVGNALIPELTTLGTAAAQVVGPLANVVDWMTKIENKSHKGSFWDGVIGAAKTGIESAGNPFAPVMDAWGQLQSYLDDGSDHVKKTVASTGDVFDDVNRRFGKLVPTAKSVAEAQAEQRAEFAKTADTLKVWAKNTEDALLAAEAFNKATSSMDWGGATLEGAAAGMSDFHDQFFGLADIAAATEAAFDGLGESLKKNGESFDLNTEKGRANQKAIEDLSSTLDGQLAAAYRDSGGDMDTFKGKAAGIADTLKGRLQKELGMSASQADDMIRRLGLMPADVETRYELSGTEEARIKIGLLQGTIDHLPENVQTKVTQQIIVGDYKGALSTIQGYYNQNPATVKVNTVVGTIQAAGARMFPGYTPAGSMVAPAAMTATATAAPSATQAPVVIPVRFALPSAAELARQIGPIRLSAKASLAAENRITGAR